MTGREQPVQNRGAETFIYLSLSAKHTKGWLEKHRSPLGDVSASRQIRSQQADQELILQMPILTQRHTFSCFVGALSASRGCEVFPEFMGPAVYPGKEKISDTEVQRREMGREVSLNPLSTL